MSMLINLACIIVFSICDFCNRKWHLSYKYRLKKNDIPKNILWVPKDTMPDKQGSNVKKVPKSASRKNSTNKEERKMFQ